MVLVGELRTCIHLQMERAELCLDLCADGQHSSVLGHRVIDLPPCALQLLRTADDN